MHIFQLSFFLLFIFSSLSQAEQFHNEFYYSNCSVADYTPNTTFETNLNALLPILTFNAHFSTFFYTERGGNPNSTVFGLFFCRGDVSFDACNACVNQATQDIKQKCPNRREAVIWYDLCMLRYSDRNFQSVYDPSINSLALMRRQHNVSEPRRFNQTLNGLLKNLSSKAAFSPSVRMLAMGEANFSASQKIYAIMACTPDLSRSDCNTCLEAAISLIPECCYGNDGAVIIGASCAMRYEVFPFYAAAPSAFRRPLSSTTNAPSGKHDFANVDNWSEPKGLESSCIRARLDALKDICFRPTPWFRIEYGGSFCCLLPECFFFSQSIKAHSMKTNWIDFHLVEEKIDFVYKCLFKSCTQKWDLRLSIQFPDRIIPPEVEYSASYRISPLEVEFRLD